MFLTLCLRKIAKFFLNSKRGRNFLFQAWSRHSRTLIIHSQITSLQQRAWYSVWSSDENGDQTKYNWCSRYEEWLLVLLPNELRKQKRIIFAPCQSKAEVLLRPLVWFYRHQLVKEFVEPRNWSDIKYIESSSLRIDILQCYS